MGNGINKILPDLYLGNIKEESYVLCFDLQDGVACLWQQLTKRYQLQCDFEFQLSDDPFKCFLHEARGHFMTLKSLPDGELRLYFLYARDRELLAQHNITHILSIHDTAAPVLEDMTYLCISAADHSKQNLMQYFRDSIVFIHESRLKGEGCLVHCVAGVSRSVTLVVAYIMTVTGRGWVESLAAVRSARPCAGPNLGFLRQLEEFENMELAEYRAWWEERYGKTLLKDDEEIQNLLTHKSTNSSSSSAVTASITPAVATSGT